MSTPGVCLDILKARQENNGVGTLTNPKKFLDQDYELLHQYYLIRNMKYIDDMFPPDNDSIGQNLLQPKDLARVEWIRPTKLVSNPYLIVDGVSRFDFAQGRVGNCWFLAAVGSLTFQKHIMKNVFPDGQSFQKNYAGIFHFRFWRFGKWVDVVIDDKLPTSNGNLIFVHPQSPKTHQSPIPEFWPALLEKAYAKVCGSYEDMNCGCVSEALMDFTGGVHMTLNPQVECPQKLWKLIHQAARANSMMGCGTPGEAEHNRQQDNGLVEGHAYAVTGVTTVKSQGNQVELIRLLNPWGDTEWKGDWNDKSQMWETVSDEDRKKYTKVVDDGEFWISTEDFCRSFCKLDICNPLPDFLDSSPESHWISTMYDGRWLAGSTAGGRIECKDTFWTNPQFPVKITGMSKASEQTEKPNMLVSVMQKPDKRNRRLTRKLYIGFSIFEVPPEMKGSREVFTASFFSTHTPVFYTKSMSDMREVMELIRLEPGEYLIIPHTYNSNNTASFILGLCSKIELHTEDSEAFHMEIGQMGLDENQKIYLKQMCDLYKEVNAEQLQKFLNERLFGGVVQSTGGFVLDACQSIVSMMDLSVTGTLNALELGQLLKKVDFYKDIFFHMDNNRDGILSLMELRHAVEGAGFRVSDKLLELMNLRFADSSGRITVDRFICLALRLRCMTKIFRKLADGHRIHLKEHEWLHLTMYS